MNYIQFYLLYILQSLKKVLYFLSKRGRQCFAGEILGFFSLNGKFCTNQCKAFSERYPLSNDETVLS